jgi:hypothetical protein
MIGFESDEAILQKLRERLRSTFPRLAHPNIRVVQFQMEETKNE